MQNIGGFPKGLHLLGSKASEAFSFEVTSDALQKHWDVLEVWGEKKLKKILLVIVSGRGLRFQN